MRVAAVIPAFQAVHSIADVVRRTLAVLAHVIVVDDGSDDGTGDAARAAGVLVLTHRENRGKGRALRTGFEHLLQDGVDGVVTVDADGQHLPEEIPKLLAEAEAGADLVLGVRDHLFAHMGRVRRVSNRVSSHLISLAAGQSISDVQTGFRFYGKRLIEGVDMAETGFDAESAVLVRATRRGFRVHVTPVELGFADGRCTSHFRPLADSLRIARAVIGARLESVP